MFGIGPMELLIVGMIGLLLFGNRLPSVMRSLGKSVTEFKKGMQDFEDELRAPPPPREALPPSPVPAPPVSSQASDTAG
jgi:sec-independent protein translocase protein TatA